MIGYTATGSHYSGFEGLPLLPVWHRVDYMPVLLVYKSLRGLAPSYFGDDCVLASSDKFRRRLRSADVDTRHMHNPEDPYPFWRPEFPRCRPPDLEQLAAGTATAKH